MSLLGLMVQYQHIFHFPLQHKPSDEKQKIFLIGLRGNASCQSTQKITTFL